MSVGWVASYENGRMMCLFTSQLSLELITPDLPTEGWLGWVDLGGRLHTEMVYAFADGYTHPTTNRARRKATTRYVTTRPNRHRYHVYLLKTQRQHDSRPSDRMPLSDWLTRRYWLQNVAECSDWNSVSPKNIPIALPRPQLRARALQTHAVAPSVLLYKHNSYVAYTYGGIQLTTFAQTTPTPHQHHNHGVGVVWPHHTHTTTFFIKFGVGVVLVWCWCGVGVVWAKVVSCVPP